MKMLVFLVMVVLTYGFWLASENEHLGKKPSDEQVIYSQERNKVTGELLNLQIVQCRICGQVLSYVKSNLKGKVVHADVYSHRCGKYGNNPMVRYNDSSVSVSLASSISEWLEMWQRKLRVRR